MRRDPFRPVWVLPLFVIASSAVALIGISTKSFWFDEGYSAELAREPLGAWWRALWSQEAGSVAHAVVLKLVAVVSDSDRALRLPSASAAVAAAVLVVRLAGRLSNGRRALAAGAMFIVSGTYAAYAQEARTYALAMLAIVGATLALVRELEQRTTRTALSYAATAILAVHVHLLAGLWLVAHACFVLLVDRAHLRRWIAMGAGVAAGLVPLGAAILIADYRSTQDSAVQPAMDLALLGWVPRELLAPHQLAGYTLLLAALIGGIRSAVEDIRAGGGVNAANRPTDPTRRIWLLIALCAVVPLAVGFVTVGLDHLRWFVPVVPFFLILAAEAIPSPDERTGAMTAVGLTVISATGLVAWHRTVEKVDAREWTTIIAEETAPADVVAFDSTFGRIVTEHYLAQRNTRLPDVHTAPQPEAFGTYFWQPERDRLGECLLDEKSVDGLMNDLTVGSSLWLIVAAPIDCPSADHLGHHLTSQGHRVELTTLDGPATVVEVTQQ